MTRQERWSCFKFSAAPTHFALQREKYDSVKKKCQCLYSILVITHSKKKKKGGGAIWKQFWIVQKTFLFPLTTVFLTIDLCRVWMAFPRILGCHCCSRTELFNSACQCCFRPRLLGETFKTIAVSSLSCTFQNSGPLLHSWLKKHCKGQSVISKWSLNLFLFSKLWGVFNTFTGWVSQEKTATIRPDPQNLTAYNTLKQSKLFLLHCCTLVVHSDKDLRGIQQKQEK